MQATVGLAGIAGSATAMPMVQTSHARLSSLVCDGSNERGKMIVGVAAHYSILDNFSTSRVHSRQKSGNGLPAVESRRSSGQHTHVHASIVMLIYSNIHVLYHINVDVLDWSLTLGSIERPR